MYQGEAPRKEGMNESWIRDLADILWDSRDWHRELQCRFQIHGAVVEAFKVGKCCDWHRLILEWPHKSLDNPKQLAYVRSIDKAAPEQNTKTTVGKYLKRHFPSLKDDVIRDLAYKHTSQRCKFLTTTEEIVDAVESGPYSCMQRKSFDGHHPYEVYDPALGWSLAVRINTEGDVVARALVYKGRWIRSYGSDGNDNELEGWLSSQGLDEGDGWREGTELKRIPSYNSCGFVAPYIDGSIQNVDDHRGRLVIDSDGAYDCSCTDGDAEGGGDPCPDCDDRTDDDDRCYINDDGDWVCEDCLRNHYTRVNYSGRRDGYYVRDCDAVNVGGDMYDCNNLPDYIARLEDGEYCHMDDAVRCVETDEWYHINDDNIVRLENGDYCLRVYAWQCSASEEWYPDSDDHNKVVVDGETYHSDNAPDPEDEDDDEEEEDLGRKPLHNYEKPDGSIANEAQAILDLVVDEGPHKWQHIIDALAEGKAVQAKWLPSFIENDRWSDMADGPDVQRHPELEWRIKHKWQHLIDAQAEGKRAQMLCGGVWLNGPWNFDSDVAEYRLEPQHELQGEEA